MSVTHYLELLVSDINFDYDLPQQFKSNLDKGSYHVEPILKSRIEKNILLKDFFDYTDDSRSIWHDFYKQHPDNITMHYGLLVFAQLIAFSNGCFYVTSSVDSIAESTSIYKRHPRTDLNISDDLNEQYFHIPGTQYEILLPIGINHGQQQTGINKPLDSTYSYTEWKCVNISDKGLVELQDAIFQGNVDPDMKQKYVHLCARKIIEEVKGKLVKNDSGSEHIIWVLDATGITNPLAAEILAKAIIFLVAEQYKDYFKQIAVVKAADIFLATFIRIFGMLYLKYDTNECMHGKQIYLSSENAEKEIVFCGRSIHKSVKVTEQLFSLKGEFYRELDMLKRAAEKCQEDFENDEMRILPFDVLVTNNFERKVESDLRRDIQHLPFGCSLQAVHLRLGSKNHVYGPFYEASLLFGINNYISRFAFLIARNLYRNRIIDPNRQLILIGYETYSELLILELENRLKREYGLHYCNHLIYEENRHDFPFKHWKECGVDDQKYFVVVVPIGSTLTTHDKIIADLRRAFKRDKVPFDLRKVIFNQSVVLIRQKGDNSIYITIPREEEQRFWEEIDTNKRVVETKFDIGSSKKVHYIVSVESDWYSQYKCKHCFPEKYTCEIPLVRVNKASVVPMTMIGLTESHKVAALPLSKIKIRERNLDYLKEALCYGHIYREDNHFQYYFKTEEVMDNIDPDKGKFKTWLDKTKGMIDSNRNQGKSVSNDNVYDIIVAPLHQTNAAFVRQVKEKVFPDSKMIIWLDVKREYRDNIKTKYSNITALYNNLIRAGKKSIISFHYVDDTIASGSSINRAKSLIQSLFDEELFDDKQIVRKEIFSSVIILLNRCSKSTQKNYVNDPQRQFFSFINLNISSIRSHKDACIMCKRQQDYINLASCSTTNYLAQYGYKQSFKYAKRNAEEIIYEEDKLPLSDQKEYHGIKNEADKNTFLNKRKNRYFYRMLYTHRFNDLFDNLPNKNIRDFVEKCIIEELNLICSRIDKDFDDSFERFYSAIKVISRPFITFRKSIQEAVLSVLLRLAGYILFEEERINTYFKNFNNIQDFIGLVEKDKEKRYSLLCLLISRLACMSSTFVLRAATINGFYRYTKNNGIPDGQDRDLFYAECIKRLLCFSRQDSLSVWLEYLLLFDKELFPENCFGLEDRDEIRRLKYLVFLENSSVIINAINEAYNEIWGGKTKDADDDIGDKKNIAQTAIDVLKRYFCDDYRKLLIIDKYCEDQKAARINFEDNDAQHKFVDDYGQKTFQYMVKLYAHLKKIMDWRRITTRNSWN